MYLDAYNELPARRLYERSKASAMSESSESGGLPPGRYRGSFISGVTGAVGPIVVEVALASNQPDLNNISQSANLDTPGARTACTIRFRELDYTLEKADGIGDSLPLGATIHLAATRPNRNGEISRLRIAGRCSRSSDNERTPILRGLYEQSEHDHLTDQGTVSLVLERPGNL